MSTSPSWFDQEKFSRLVKKVGPKPAPEAAQGQPGAEPENRLISEGQEPGGSPAAKRPFSAPEQAQASTAHISLVSKPPSLLSEHRALPALPRRTMPLPALKSLFPSSVPPLRPPAETPAQDAPPVESLPESNQEDGPTGNEEAAPVGDEEGELAEVWQKMGQLNEELARTILERDQAVNEGILLREQLRQADETLESRESAGAPAEELSRLAKERDEAVSEGKALREQLSKAQESRKEPGAPTQTKELVLLTEERDQARREYATVREQFETLKMEQAPPREESGKFRKELEQQLEGFRLKLEERNREISLLKANPGAGSSDEAVEKLRQEVLSLREQLTRAKDESSVAQRGLALSQKALHETRDTLREATEGSSLSRHNFDNLKNECAALAQQNTVLQAQNEQLLRDLGAAKSKLTTRL